MKQRLAAKASQGHRIGCTAIGFVVCLFFYLVLINVEQQCEGLYVCYLVLDFYGSVSLCLWVRFCGNWQNQLNMFTLDSHSAKVFMRTLQGPEVQSKSFNFSLLCSDNRCAQVNKILKKKVNDVVSSSK